MVYFWIVLMAIMFTVLGFLIHEYYFSKEELVNRLYDELQTVENRLAFRERENATVQQEIAQSRALIQSLEIELAQRNEQLSSLRTVTRRQEEEIRDIQEEAKELRRISAALKESRRSVAQADSDELRPVSDFTPRDVKIPLWKEILNNILNLLNNETEAREQNW